MKDYEKLKEMLCDEVSKIAKKGELSAGSLETVQKLTDTIKNIGKIEMLEGSGEYSEDDGMWRAEGSYRGGSGGTSYARGRGRNARRDSMGRYSSDGDTSYRRGGYSRDEGKDYMVEQIEGLMDDADPKSREALRRAIKQIEGT